MKQVVLNIPDNKYSDLIELLKNVEYVTIAEDDLEISEEHKSIVRQRIKSSEADPSRLLSWDKVKHQLKF